MKLALALALIVGGCAKSPKTLDLYFPLQVGDEWHYAHEDFAGHRAVDRSILGRRDGDGGTCYLLDSRGGSYFLRDAHTVSISVEPGIWTIFLEDPLVLGHRFDGARTTIGDIQAVGEPPAPEPTPTPTVGPVPSEGYKVITGFDRTITVPAGTFHDCLEVSHIAGHVIGVKYFAPHVGMVLSEAWMTGLDGRRSLLQRDELQSFRVHP